MWSVRSMDLTQTQLFYRKSGVHGRLVTIETWLPCQCQLQRMTSETRIRKPREARDGGHSDMYRDHVVGDDESQESRYRSRWTLTGDVKVRNWYPLSFYSLYQNGVTDPNRLHFYWRIRKVPLRSPWERVLLKVVGGVPGDRWRGWTGRSSLERIRTHELQETGVEERGSPWSKWCSLRSSVISKDGRQDTNRHSDTPRP